MVNIHAKVEWLFPHITLPITYGLSFGCLAHLGHGGKELANEVRGRRLVPVIAPDSDTAGWISATQQPGLHFERRPVRVQSVEDMLWSEARERMENATG